MKKQQFLMFAAAAIMMIPAYGCSPAARQETGFVGNVNPPVTAGNVGPNRDIRNRSAYVFRPDLADHVRTQIPGITQASVFVRSNNAYVAVSDGTMPRTGNVERIVPRDRVLPQDGTGGGTITGRPAGPADGTLTGRPAPWGATPLPGGPAPGVPRVFGGTATGIPSVDGRTGGYTGRGITGYPGPIVGQTALTKERKQRIATEVRRIDPAIQNVYISDDPALLSHFRGYATGSLRTSTDDFNNMIRQFFLGSR